MPFKPIDETGNVYGLLTVVCRSKVNGKQGDVRWFCHCACGGTKTTSGTILRKGECISCGCQKGMQIPSEYRTNRTSKVQRI